MREVKERKWAKDVELMWEEVAQRGTRKRLQEEVDYGGLQVL